MPKKIVFNPFTSNFDTISEIALQSVGSSPNSAGASVDSNQNLTLQPADATHPGLVSTTTQTIAGNKTLTGTITASNLSGTNTGDITLTAVGFSPNSNAASLIGQQLQLQIGDASNAGLLSTSAQSIAGNKTFNNGIIASGGIDASGTLAIGTGSATTINIGNVASTINLVGTVITETTTTLNVTNPVFTVNHGGGSGSASNSGMQVEEASTITGYVETSADRNSWILKAPNTAGVATITPGVSGITLNQSSHSPVTITSVGSSPNANGLTLTGQQLNLEPASATQPGIITTGTQTIAGSKTFSSSPTITGLASGPVRSSSGTLTTGNTSLTTEVSGTLPIANGGTNSSTTLNNNRTIVSSGGSIVEAAAASNGQLLIGSTSAAPVVANITPGTSINVTNGAGSITIATTQNLTTAGSPSFTGVAIGTLSGPLRGSSGVVGTGNTSLTSEVSGVLPIANGGTNNGTALNNGRMMGSNLGTILEMPALSDGQIFIGRSGGVLPQQNTLTAGTGISISNGSGSITISNSSVGTGDIGQTSFAAAQTQTNATVTGLTFSNASIRSFEAQVSVAISATSSLYEVFSLRGIQRGSDWQMSVISVGDASGFSFTINTSGQVLYSSGTYAGFTSAAVRFRAFTLLV